MSDEHLAKSHNRTLLMFHLVFPAKFRKRVFSREVEETLRQVCLGIEERYEIRFIEIGMEEDHVHFLVQGVPTMSVRRIVTIIKSITAREIFKAHPGLRKNELWGGNLWTSGYYVDLCRYRDNAHYTDIIIMPTISGQILTQERRSTVVYRHNTIVIIQGESLQWMYSTLLKSWHMTQE